MSTPSSTLRSSGESQSIRLTLLAVSAASGLREAIRLIFFVMLVFVKYTPPMCISLSNSVVLGIFSNLILSVPEYGKEIKLILVVGQSVLSRIFLRDKVSYTTLERIN